MKILYTLAFVLLLACSGQKTENQNASDIEKKGTPLVIAFGSCAHEDEPQPIFEAVAAAEPDLFVWLGDIVYGDTDNMDTLRHKYALQKQDSSYQKLLAGTPVTGVYDDHDYGRNDAGKEYPFRAESRDILLEYLEVPLSAEVWEREGAYQSQTIDHEGKKVKLILLDTRYFRDELLPDTTGNSWVRYRENPDGDVLGEAQWQWLEQELSDESIDLYVVGSSIQLVAEEHGWEKWANLPKAKSRFVELVKQTSPKALVVISGDRHIAEISAQPVEGLNYPIVDFTSSGLTHTWSELRAEPNRFRDGEMIAELNYGMLNIEFGDSLKVNMEVRGLENQVFLSRTYTY